MNKMTFPEFDEHAELTLLNEIDDVNEKYSLTIDASDTMNQYLTRSIHYHPLLLRRYISLLACFNHLCDFMPEAKITMPNYLRCDLQKAMDEVDQVFSETENNE